MPSTTSLYIATVNIRMDAKHDHPVPLPASGSLPAPKKLSLSDSYKERPWSERRTRLVDALLSTGPIDIVGFQEVYKNALDDISALLGPDYAHVGVGREDGKEKGEYSPIFFDTSKFELVRWKTVWLSPTPEVPGSIGWDADQTRIATLCTLAFLTGPEAGTLIHAVNTHYDHIGVKARAKSSLLIREQIASWVLRFENPNDPTHVGKAPILLFGDFNSPPTEEGYKNITSSHRLSSGSPSFTFLDAFTHLKLRSAKAHGQTACYGPEMTFTDFFPPGKGHTSRIDFVMLASARDPGASEAEETKSEAQGRGGWEVIRYACVDNWVEEGDVDGWSGRWSDHRAVRVRLDRSG